MSDVDSQCAAILDALQSGRSLTPAEALREYGCFRLAARIYDLRQMGHNITTLWQKANNKRWARYTLLQSAKS